MSIWPCVPSHVNHFTVVAFSGFNRETWDTAPEVFHMNYLKFEGTYGFTDPKARSHPTCIRNVNRQSGGIIHEVIGSNTVHPTSPAHVYATCAQGVFCRIMQFSSGYTQYALLFFLILPYSSNDLPSCYTFDSQLRITAQRLFRSTMKS